MSTSLILRAAKFAEAAHIGQFRKWSGRQYIIHPGRVAARVSTHKIASEETVATAWLHDVLEDTTVTKQQLLDQFGHKTTSLVSELTNTNPPHRLDRAARKKIDRDRLAGISQEAKVIKLLDRLDNLYDLSDAPEDFKQLYVEESNLLIGAIGTADEVLTLEMLSLFTSFSN